jgi:RadC-like JAB domain
MKASPTLGRSLSRQSVIQPTRSSSRITTPRATPRESEADRQLTRRVAEAARLLQIHLLDHVICGTPQQGRPGFFSFEQAGLL